MLCINVQNSDLPKNEYVKIKYWKFVDANEMLKVSRNIEKNLLKVMCFFFMELSVLCAVWSVHFTNFFFDSKVFVAVHYISFAKGKTKRNQFVYIATLCRKQQTHLFDNSCVSQGNLTWIFTQRLSCCFEVHCLIKE